MGLLINSYTPKDSLHIGKKTFICVIFVCCNYTQSHSIKAVAPGHILFGVRILRCPVGNSIIREVADRWVTSVLLPSVLEKPEEHVQRPEN